jgi:hypothetical protein
MSEPNQVSSREILKLPKYIPVRKKKKKKGQNQVQLKFIRERSQ